MILIHIPRFLDIEVPKAKVCLAGEYMIAKFHPGRPYHAMTPWFPNIILDSGLNRWGTGLIIAGAAMGTGTSTPVASQTALDAQATYTTSLTPGGSSLVSPGISPYNNGQILAYRTALGALSGSYTEVGVGWASGQMFSRALILDGGGSPTSFPVASDEQADIYYRLDGYPPLVDYTDTVTVSAVSTDVTGRAVNVNSTSSFGWVPPYFGAIGLGIGMSNNPSVWNGPLGAITAANPTGTSATGSLTIQSNTYSSSSLQRTGSITHGPTAGNVASGIQSTRVVWGTNSQGFVFQYEWDPVIDKTSLRTLVLNYGIEWARRP